MFDDELYEVTRDEFKGFIDQIKPGCFDYEIHKTCNEDTYNVETQEIRVTSTDGKRLFAKVVSTIYEAHYYVYEMPHEDERRAGRAVRKIVLESPEDVKAFFDVLNKVQKESKHD